MPFFFLFCFFTKCYWDVNRVCFIPGVQVFPSVCKLMPVGQAQLEALGAGARRQRWLQPPLFTAHGLCTTGGEANRLGSLPVLLSKSAWKQWMGDAWKKLRGEKKKKPTKTLGKQTAKTLLATQQSQIHHRDQTGFTGSVLSANDLGSVYL